ncbi:MAG: 6,7-dimethyl-8-ribityllumazine synthase [Planctomycetota bacterium]|nr:6,7-dimethyl-8-ribityllumazine synthase [Planctomycetota bacterium]
MHDAPSLNLDATGLRVGLVTSLYHEEVTNRLRDGAVSAFLDAGGDPDDLYQVVAAGAFELIPLADALARKDLDAVVVLGCVIRGETRHDEYICSTVTRMIGQISFEHEIPIGLGLLTLLALDQGFERAGGEKGNKGEEAMNAAISSALSIRAIDEDLADGMGDGESEDDDGEEEYEYELVDEEEEEGDPESDTEIEYEYEEGES